MNQQYASHLLVVRSPIELWRELHPGDLVVLPNEKRAWMVLGIRLSLSTHIDEVEIQWITLWHDSVPTGHLSLILYFDHAKIPDRFIVIRP